MQQSQEMSGEAKEVLSDAVNETLGDPETLAESAAEHPDEPEKNELPEFAKKKLGMQEKRHKKELRRMQQQLDEVRAHLGSRPEPQYSPEQPMNPYTSQPEMGNMNEQVYAAVSKALQMQKEQESKAKHMERMQHVHKQYKALEDHLDNASNKYEDFDDIVKSDDAPYTESMRDAALLISNPGETLYHLGKDRDKLKKISELHPLEQAREVVKLSIALMSGGGKSNGSNGAKPLGQIKNNPINTHSVNENTSVGDLRKRMRDGGKKWG